jgi:DNA sulfur modification protein DndC
MEAAADAQKLPFQKHRLTPKTTETFWVNLLGRGYPYPRPNFRWCTERMKIHPANNFVQEVVAAHGEVILILGTRKAESSVRARTMNYYASMRVREHLSPNATMQNELVFSPLEDWTDDDVWTFLMQYKNPWNYSNKELLALYRGATADNECPLVMNADTPSCGKSRFGCWVCTLVEQDKSMAAMIQNDSEKAWMSALLEFRNHIGNPIYDRERRDFRRKTGRVHEYNERLVHGPYKKDIREDWLRRLLKIQRNINENGPKEFRSLELITLPELREIRRIWLDEYHEFDDSLPAIYESVFGKTYRDDYYIEGAFFGAAEWRLLKETCEAFCPEEKLMPTLVASLIDHERKSSGLKGRTDVRFGMEREIQKCYYRDEEDALEFVRLRKEIEDKFGGKIENPTVLADDDEEPIDE